MKKEGLLILLAGIILVSLAILPFGMPAAGCLNVNRGLPGINYLRTIGTLIILGLGAYMIYTA